MLKVHSNIFTFIKHKIVSSVRDQMNAVSQCPRFPSLYLFDPSLLWMRVMLSPLSMILPSSLLVFLLV